MDKHSHSRILVNLSEAGEGDVPGVDILNNGRGAITGFSTLVDWATEQGLDLRLVNTAEDGTRYYRLVNPDRERYRQAKKRRKAKKPPTQKTVRLRSNIAAGDRGRKIASIATFLKKGHTVKVLLVPRGREKFPADVLAAVEQVAREHGSRHQVTRNGRNVAVMIFPKKTGAKA